MTKISEEKFVEFLKKHKEKENDKNWQAASTMLSFISFSSPIEWDHSMFTDDQEVIFLPIRIPEMFTEVIKSLPKDFDRNKIIKILCFEVFMNGLCKLATSTLLKNERDSIIQQGLGRVTNPLDKEAIMHEVNELLKLMKSLMNQRKPEDKS